MKCMRFFLLLLLIPNLVYATFYTPDYAKVLEKIGREWKQHENLIQQFSNLGPDEREQGVHLLREAISCCQRANEHCDYILRKIASKSKTERHQEYWVYVKNKTNQDKNNLNNEITALQNAINTTYQDAALRKAVSLFQECEKKAALARQKSLECSLHLNNSENIVSLLRETGRLYEEALLLAQQSLDVISPYPDEASKNTLRQTIETCRVGADKFKKEADEWPAAVPFYQNILREWFALLKEQSKLSDEEGQKQASYEIQKNIVTILEQLIASQEDEALQEELAQFKASILAFEKEVESS